jgi:hypothetical protein
MRIVAGHELGQERHEEQDDLRIRQIDPEPQEERAPNRNLASAIALEIQGRAGADRIDGEPEKIERPDDLQDREGGGGGCEQRRQSKRGEQRVNAAPGHGSEHRRHAGPATAGDRLRQEQAHVRARRGEQDEAGERVGQEDGGVGQEHHGRASGLTSARPCRIGGTDATTLRALGGGSATIPAPSSPPEWRPDVRARWPAG